MDRYAYYILGHRGSGDKIAIVKWHDGENRWISPDKEVVNGLFFEITTNTDLAITGDEELDSIIVETDHGFHPLIENSMVYFCKAKNAEEIGDFKAREYFMRLARNAAGKYSTLMTGGMKRVSSGGHAIR
tara:strand:- start:679 stop:1068 length:390 start_codon:yes stop_codon:yes gene_type:complete